MNWVSLSLSAHTTLFFFYGLLDKPETSFSPEHFSWQRLFSSWKNFNKLDILQAESLVCYSSQQNWHLFTCECGGTFILQLDGNTAWIPLALCFTHTNESICVRRCFKWLLPTLLSSPLHSSFVFFFCLLSFHFGVWSQRHFTVLMPAPVWQLCLCVMWCRSDTFITVLDGCPNQFSYCMLEKFCVKYKTHDFSVSHTLIYNINIDCRILIFFLFYI